MHLMPIEAATSIYCLSWHDIMMSSFILIDRRSTTMALGCLIHMVDWLMIVSWCLIGHWWFTSGSGLPEATHSRVTLEPSVWFWILIIFLFIFCIKIISKYKDISQHTGPSFLACFEAGQGFGKSIRTRTSDSLRQFCRDILAQKIVLGKFGWRNSN